MFNVEFTDGFKYLVRLLDDQCKGPETLKSVYPDRVLCSSLWEDLYELAINDQPVPEMLWDQAAICERWRIIQPIQMENKPKVGDKVVMSELGKTVYKDTVRNPHDGTGVLLSDKESAMGFCYQVRWPGNRENSYAAGEIEGWT